MLVLDATLKPASVNQALDMLGTELAAMAPALDQRQCCL
jgi:hypothetical protein